MPYTVEFAAQEFPVGAKVRFHPETCKPPALRGLTVCSAPRWASVAAAQRGWACGVLVDVDGLPHPVPVTCLCRERPERHPTTPAPGE